MHSSSDSSTSAPNLCVNGSRSHRRLALLPCRPDKKKAGNNRQQVQLCGLRFFRPGDFQGHTCERICRPMENPQGRPMQDPRNAGTCMLCLTCSIAFPLSLFSSFSPFSPFFLTHSPGWWDQVSLACLLFWGANSACAFWVTSGKAKAGPAAHIPRPTRPQALSFLCTADWPALVLIKHRIRT